MSIIDSLVFDREDQDVENLINISKLSWDKMSKGQKNEWIYGRSNVKIYWKEGTEIECTDGIIYCINNEGTNKGSYNYQDLNRVGEAVEYLRSLFGLYGYEVTVEPKTDWYFSDNPEENEMKQYLANVRNLRSVVKLLEATPQVPENMTDLTVEEANAIERILFDIDRTIERIKNSFRRSGQFTFWSGYKPLP